MATYQIAPCPGCHDWGAVFRAVTLAPKGMVSLGHLVQILVFSPTDFHTPVTFPCFQAWSPFFNRYSCNISTQGS